MTMSANARFAMKKFVTFCMRLDVAIIHMTREFPTTAKNDIVPYAMLRSTSTAIGTSYLSSETQSIPSRDNKDGLYRNELKYKR